MLICCCLATLSIQHVNYCVTKKPADSARSPLLNGLTSSEYYMTDGDFIVWAGLEYQLFMGCLVQTRVKFSFLPVYKKNEKIHLSLNYSNFHEIKFCSTGLPEST